MKRNKKIRILIYLENGQIYPTIKICDHDNIEVIVVNNDRQIIWKPQVIEECDAEIEEVSDVVDEMQFEAEKLGTRIKRRKKG